MSHPPPTQTGSRYSPWMALSRDSMALVGVDYGWNVIYARCWQPPKGGTIDHRVVLTELLDLADRFTVLVFAYAPNPATIHGLVLDALQAGLPMMAVSQAAGRAGGTMARHAAALVEALHERRLRVFPDEELAIMRQPLALFGSFRRRPACEASCLRSNRSRRRPCNGGRRSDWTWSARPYERRT